MNIQIIIRACSSRKNRAGQAITPIFFCKEAAKKGFPLYPSRGLDSNMEYALASAIVAKILRAVLLRGDCSVKRARTPKKIILFIDLDT